jgi:hypothetical protein
MSQPYSPVTLVRSFHLLVIGGTEQPGQCFRTSIIGFQTCSELTQIERPVRQAVNNSFSTKCTFHQAIYVELHTVASKPVVESIWIVNEGLQGISTEMLGQSCFDKPIVIAYY